MKKALPIKGVLFDMDETLIDWSKTTQSWAQEERKHLDRLYDYLLHMRRALRCTPTEFEKAYRKNVLAGWETGRSTLRAPRLLEIMEATLRQFGFVPDAAIDIRACIDAYAWGAAPGVVVYPDVPAGLAALLERGIKIGIITNAFQPMWLRDRELVDLDLFQYFEHSCRITAADVGYLKPHPRIFLHGVATLGTALKETIYVGDNPVADIAGAQGVGMRAVLRVNNPTPPLISGLIIPDAAINSFAELVALIDDPDNWSEPVFE